MRWHHPLFAAAPFSLLLSLFRFASERERDNHRSSGDIRKNHKSFAGTVDASRFEPTRQTIFSSYSSPAASNRSFLARFPTCTRISRFPWNFSAILSMDTSTLIREVHLRRPIWDRTDPLHQSRDTVNKLWQEVGKKCGVKRECARAKWKHLRDTFRSQLKKCQNKKPGDQWMWYKSLSFLADQMRTRDAGSCCSPNDPDNDEQPPVLSKNEEGSSTDESNPVRLSVLDREPPLGLPYKRKADYLLENDFPELHTSTNEYQVQSVTDSDANYYFMLSLLPQMSSLPPTKQMLLRLKIQELVVQEVLANQNESVLNGNLVVPTE